MSGFHFKGSRTYIQGATFFDYILERCVSGRYAPAHMDFSVSRLTDRQCRVVPSGEPPPDAARVIGQYRDDLNAYLFVETDEPVSERVPYDETGITGRCVLDGPVITVPSGIAGYTFMEKVIGAYKSLLTSLFGETYGKYLFARVTLEYLPADAFSVRYERMISGRYFEGTISEKGHAVGKIYFGVKKP